MAQARRNTTEEAPGAAAAEAPSEQKTGQEVATTRPGAAPAYLQGHIQQDAGKGVSTKAEDNLVPLIYVLQGLSPQVNDRDPNYIEGARSGDIWLRGASVPIIKGIEGILAQPVYFYEEVVEWWPRDGSGGQKGFVARHDKMPADAIEQKDPERPNRRDFVSPRGTEYVETRNHVVLIHTEYGVIPYVISLSGTGHTVSRQWMTMYNAKRLGKDIVPSWACIYRLKTIQKTNADGSWFVLSPADERIPGAAPGPCWVSEEDYARGKALHEAFAAGIKKAEVPTDEQQSGGGTGDGANDSALS